MYVVGGIMFKQAGMTTVELLTGLLITSSATYATLEMADQAEESVREYQQLTDVKHAMKKIKEGRGLMKTDHVDSNIQD